MLNTLSRFISAIVNDTEASITESITGTVTSASTQRRRTKLQNIDTVSLVYPLPENVIKTLKLQTMLNIQIQVTK